MSVVTENIITAQLIDDETARFDFTSQMFGTNYLQGERAVYLVNRQLEPSYIGGVWNYHLLSNGGCFMSQKSEAQITISSPMNQFEGSLSAEGAGIVVSLLAFCHLHQKNGEDFLAERYQQLDEYARQHMDWSTISRILD